VAGAGLEQDSEALGESPGSYPDDVGDAPAEAMRRDSRAQKGRLAMDVARIKPKATDSSAMS